MTRYEPSSSVRGSDMESVNEAKKQKVASYASGFDAFTYHVLCKYLFTSGYVTSEFYAY